MIRYVDYCLKRLRLLQDFGVIPVVVFDGGPLPMKRRTETERRRQVLYSKFPPNDETRIREESKSRGLQYLKEGNSEAALECFQKSVDITPQMAHNLIKVLTVTICHNIIF
jgi:exonuclease-1